jgi:hypothetical protein
VARRGNHSLPAGSGAGALTFRPPREVPAALLNPSAAHRSENRAKGVETRIKGLYGTTIRSADRVKMEHRPGCLFAPGSIA